MPFATPTRKATNKAAKAAIAPNQTRALIGQITMIEHEHGLSITRRRCLWKRCLWSTCCHRYWSMLSPRKTLLEPESLPCSVADIAVKYYSRAASALHFVFQKSTEEGGVERGERGRRARGIVHASYWYLGFLDKKGCAGQSLVNLAKQDPGRATQNG